MKFISIQPGDGSKFDKAVSERPSFVKFYHPMCGHCVNMGPAWKKLKTNTKLADKDINVIEVHAGEIPNIKSSVARKADNQGVPFIIEAKKGGEAGAEYNGDRSEDDMTNFILNNVTNHMQKGGKKHTKRYSKRYTKKHTKKHGKRHTKKHSKRHTKKHTRKHKK